MPTAAQRALLSFSLLIGLLQTMACREALPQSSPPVEEQRMVNTLVDIHIAEAALNRDGKLAELSDSLAALYYYEILREQQLSSADFEAAMNYYNQDAKAYKRLYDKVIEKLKKIEGYTPKKSGSPKDELRHLINAPRPSEGKRDTTR